jgi:hypothetical protein
MEPRQWGAITHDNPTTAALYADLDPAAPPPLVEEFNRALMAFLSDSVSLGLPAEEPGPREAHVYFGASHAPAEVARIEAWLRGQGIVTRVVYETNS